MVNNPPKSPFKKGGLLGVPTRVCGNESWFLPGFKRSVTRQNSYTYITRQVTLRLKPDGNLKHVL